MARFHFDLRHSSSGESRGIRLLDDESGACADIAVRGATLLALRLAVGDEPVEVVDGYEDEDEFANLTGARSAILAPFSNRLAAGRYRFDGVDYVLEPSGSDGNALHGLVNDVNWRLVSASAEEGAAAVDLRTTALRAGDFPGYPFSIDLRVQFRLTSSRLDLTLTADNTGRRDAPLGLGWHPYLKPPSGDPGQCRLTLPHRCAIATDAQLIPLPGPSAYVDVDGGPMDFTRGGREVGKAVLDTCFVSRADAPRGWIRSTLDDPRAGIRFVLAQQSGAIHVFTGDTLPNRARHAVAIEPTEFMPDAFNRPELAEAVRLRAGERRVFRAGIGTVDLQ